MLLNYLAKLPAKKEMMENPIEATQPAEQTPPEIAKEEPSSDVVDRIPSNDLVAPFWNSLVLKRALFIAPISLILLFIVWVTILF